MTIENGNLIKTASGTIALEDTATDTGEVIYQITYLTPEREIKAGAITVSTDSRVDAKPGYVSVHFGSGDLTDRHTREDAPMVGRSTYAVGRAAFDPATIGENGEAFRTRFADAPTGASSYPAEIGSKAQIRTGELVRAVVDHFLNRPDFKDLSGKMAATMAELRLAGPLARKAKIQKEIDGLALEMAEVDAEIAALSAFGTGESAEPTDKK